MMTSPWVAKPKHAIRRNRSMTWGGVGWGGVISAFVDEKIVRLAASRLTKRSLATGVPLDRFLSEFAPEVDIDDDAQDGACGGPRGCSG